jgi:hypothetical protein
MHPNYLFIPRTCVFGTVIGCALTSFSTLESLLHAHRSPSIPGFGAGGPSIETMRQDRQAGS